MKSQPMRLTQAEKESVIKQAGPHRTVNFRFERNTQTRKLVCVGAMIPREGNS